MKYPFQPNYWGRLSQFEIPHSIVHDEVLIFKPHALAVLFVLFEVGKAQQRMKTGSTIQVKVTQELLTERSGYSKNEIPKAVAELEKGDFVRCSASRKKRGEYGSNVYTLLNPGNGIALEAKGRNILYGNGIQYIKIPVCVVKEHGAEWSIANMTSSEIRMYVSICWQANRKNQSEFDFTIAALKKLGGFSTSGITQKALDGLIDKSLISILGNGMILHDPYTGEPLHMEDGDPYSDPANYYNSEEQGRATRWNLNTGNPEQVEQLLRDCGLEPIEQNDGELAILCPFHSDSNPSCFVNPKKRCFYCHGCQKAGTVTELVMRLRGTGKGEAIEFMAERTGQTIEFHEPDKNAVAVYSYFDANGKLKKQVLRYPGKRFSQRRPARGAWIWNADDVPPMLYNLQWLEYASEVCICEGEKDCDTVMALKLYGTRGGDVVAITSGNAESWRDQLANHLTGKRVVLMPDADEPGERYRAEVEGSLKTRGIEYRVVGFGGTGAKDVSDFVANGGTSEDIIQRIGKDWVRAKASSVFGLDEEEVAQTI